MTSTFPAAAENASYTKYMSTRQFGSLDGLRALAVMGVVWHHTTNDLPLAPALHRGFLGVDFFFVISGFLIVTLLLRELRATETISLRKFYARRTLRILPAYAAMLCFVAYAAYLRPGHESDMIKHELPYALLYLSNLVPMASLLSITWSLSTEEQFYLVVPALQKYLPRFFPLVLLPFAYVIASALSFDALPSIEMPGFFRQTTFGPILIGVMLAHVLDRPRGWKAAASLLRSKLSPAFALGLVAAAFCYPGANLSGWPRLAVHVSLAVLLTSCVIREHHVLLPILSWRPIRRIGTVSYGIYLYHLIVYWPAAKLLSLTGFHSPYALFILVAAFGWLAAELSYQLLERRFLALKGGFASSRAKEQRAAGLTGSPMTGRMSEEREGAPA